MKTIVLYEKGDPCYYIEETSEHVLEVFESTVADKQSEHDNYIKIYGNKSIYKTRVFPDKKSAQEAALNKNLEFREKLISYLKTLNATISEQQKSLDMVVKNKEIEIGDWL